MPLKWCVPLVDELLCESEAVAAAEASWGVLEHPGQEWSVSWMKISQSQQKWFLQSGHWYTLMSRVLSNVRAQAKQQLIWESTSCSPFICKKEANFSVLSKSLGILSLRHLTFDLVCRFFWILSILLDFCRVAFPGIPGRDFPGNLDFFGFGNSREMKNFPGNFPKPLK